MTEPDADRPNKALPGNNPSDSPAVASEGQTAPTMLNALYAEKQSWRAVADGLEKVSPALAWKVAHNRCESARVERALGLREKRYRVALEVDTPDEAAALRALLARHGSRRRVARALVRGELRIVENGECDG